MGISRLHLCCLQRCVIKCVYESRTLCTTHTLLHASHKVRVKVWGFLVCAYIVCKGVSQTVYVRNELLMSHELCVRLIKSITYESRTQSESVGFSRLRLNCLQRGVAKCFCE